MVDILIVGATGFCGRHAARYILQHPERSKYTVGLAARSRSKLASIGLPLDDSVQVFKVDIFDARAIESAVKQAKVVLNCVGPFWHYGTPVVRCVFPDLNALSARAYAGLTILCPSACARHGIHYVDITGETPWILDIIKEFDYLATKTRAVIVPSCGVDSIPADASVHLASKALGRVPLGASLTSAGLRGGAPGGTIASFFAVFEDVPSERIKDSARDWALSPVRGARSPAERLVYRLGRRAHVGGIAVFGRVNRAIVQRTAGLLELHRRSARAGDAGGRGAAATGSGDLACYGPAFTYTEFTPTGNVVSAFLLSLAIGLTFVTLKFIAPFRWVVKHLVTQPGSGPADHTLESGRLEYVNVTMSDEPSPRCAKTIIKARGDPGTLLTAVMVGESALALLFGELTPLAAGGGVLTPMTAFGDSIIRRLKANERFEITSGIVDSPDEEVDESRKRR
ncbi:NAD-P-binding protein [Russula earlei]|uniref:NAD-P-binding protein n=1 Tax=Russula earlei TaxID=71964 RepID=A0ACC0UFC5_9AGAM|nr:NAD-P-binding protein [Russula earlei]